MKCGACQRTLVESYVCAEFSVPRVVVTFCNGLCAFWGGVRWHAAAPTSAAGMRELFGSEAVHDVPAAANQEVTGWKFCNQAGGYIDPIQGHVRGECVFERGHEGPHSWEPSS